MTNPPFIWPLGYASTPDEMNTSYGPRIDEDEWDFHDGIDLPAPIGTAVHAVADGVVHRAGPADTTEPGKGFRSTHIVLKVVDPTDDVDDLFAVYLHLDRIATGIVADAEVKQGDVIGAVGREDATYPHLHFEFRKGGTLQRHGRHPLHYLPYVNTANVTTPELDRCNFSGPSPSLRAIRVRFDVPKRWEGDVQRIDVQLRRPDGTNPDNKFVDFDDRDTIKSSQGDDKAFNDNDVAVEGYQKSNLKGDNRIGLKYGVLLRNIAAQFSSARIQVRDTLGVHSVASEFNLPTLAANASAINSDVSFEDPAFPPQGWTVRTRTGNVCQRDSAAGIDSLHGLLCQDVVGSPAGLVRAALRFALPVDRPVAPMSWRLRARLRAAEIPTDQGIVIYPMAFLAGNTLVAAVCLRVIHTGKIVAGVSIRAEDGMLREKINVTKGQIAPTDKQRWELELLRIGTRETTAVLRLNDTEEVARLDGDTAEVEPNRAFAGILHRHNNIAVTLHLDELLLTEEPRP
jgi:hypothetical protein